MRNLYLKERLSRFFAVFKHRCVSSFILLAVKLKNKLVFIYFRIKEEKVKNRKKRGEGGMEGEEEEEECTIDCQSQIMNRKITKREKEKGFLLSRMSCVVLAFLLTIHFFFFWGGFLFYSSCHGGGR